MAISSPWSMVTGMMEMMKVYIVHVRQQAAKLCDLALKHNLIQYVDKVTHGNEILDLIYTNDDDLVSSIQAESWPTFTDHSVVSATVSYQLGRESAKMRLTCLILAGD